MGTSSFTLRLGLCLLYSASQCQLTQQAGVRLAPDAAEIRSACYFAYTLKLDLPGSNHHTLRAADFQSKVAAFYSGQPSGPPVEEAAWILSLPENMQSAISSECPAFVILAYLIIAEAKLYVAPPEALELAAVAMDSLRRLDERLLSFMMESWPIEQAVQSFTAAQQRIQLWQQIAPVAFSVDFVIAHCKEDLQWLRMALPHLKPPGAAKLYIYEKCGARTSVEDWPIPVVLAAVNDDGPGGRKDECSAYLTHMVQASTSSSTALYTIFMQADALDHTRIELFDLVLQSMRHRTLDVPFLHLSQARMVSSTSPCKRAIVQQATGRALQRPLRGYCCAQFMVRRDIIVDPGPALWQRALSAMDASLPDGCEGVRAATGMHCLVYEAAWHFMLGKQEELKPRSEDVELPLFLRYPDADHSNLPGAENATQYFRAVVAEDASAWIDAITTKGLDLTGARSMGYLPSES